ncbi:MAG: hypothetical protein Q4F71_07310 [Paracoccus sp. (in: a-proteobacteria)]|nr:hypothetical protein [Paracoccus sp. (in: a-proteobacteria)]
MSAPANSPETALDALCAAPFHEQDAAGRARVLSQLANTELFVALDAEPAGDQIALRIFEAGGARLAIAADLEERLSAFLGGAVPFAAMPGRTLAAMLAGGRAAGGARGDAGRADGGAGDRRAEAGCASGTGGDEAGGRGGDEAGGNGNGCAGSGGERSGAAVGPGCGAPSVMVNPGAPSQMLLDAEALSWLDAALQAAPALDEAAPARLSAPAPEMVARLAEPLAARLADMAGLASGAALVAAEWADGAKAHLIVLAGADEPARPALAKALAEYLAFLPPLPQPCDIAFDLDLPQGALELRIDPPPAPERTPTAPGMDPNRPPILR